MINMRSHHAGVTGTRLTRAGRWRVHPIHRAVVVGMPIAALASILGGSGWSAGAALTSVGYRDHSFGAVIPPSSDPNDGPTAQKPQSKLWFNDSLWWGCLLDNQDRAFHIYRFDWSAQSWSDTGTLIDSRGVSHADALWDSTHLYTAGISP